MISRLINTNSKGASFSITFLIVFDKKKFIYCVKKKNPLGSASLFSVMLLLRPLNFFIDTLW